MRLNPQIQQKKFAVNQVVRVIVFEGKSSASSPGLGRPVPEMNESITTLIIADFLSANA